MRRVLGGRWSYATLIAALGIACASTASGQCGVHLTGQSMVSNVPGGTPDVRCLFVRDPDGPGPLPEELNIGGVFEYAGDQFSSGVVTWDGSRWKGYGTVRGQRVDAMTEWQSDLFVAGEGYSMYESPFACDAAAWNGRAWMEYCPPASGYYLSAATFQNQLFIGGTSNLSHWDGQRWQYQTGTPTGTFKTMKVIDNELYVGGALSWTGDRNARGIFAYNGSTWRSVNGWSSFQHVRAINRYQGDLVIGGSFGSGAIPGSNYVSRWNGTTWERLEGNLTGWTLALEVFQGRLYAGTGSTLSRWNDANRQWETIPMPGVTSPAVQALAVFNSKLVVGGRFPGGVRLFDGVNWSNLSEGPTTGEFKAQVEFNGDRYIGGQFTMSQFPGAFTFGKLQGTDIIPLGGQQLTGTITDLIVFNGSIYAGGDFVGSGSEPIRGFARWDGQQWRSIGDVWTGTSGNVIVTGLLIVNNELIISGSFPATAQHGSNIAAFNGTQWRDLDGGALGTVSALGMYRGNLIASGDMAFANRPELGELVQFDGVQWRPLTSSPVNIGGGVNVLVEHAGELYVGGTFTSINGLPATQLAKFDGSVWTVLPDISGNGSYVSAMCSVGNQLFVGKDGGTAIWNGAGWIFLRGYGAALSIARDADGVIFTRTNIPMYTPPVIVRYRPCCPGDYDSSESVDITDLTTFLNDWFLGRGSTNANFDNAVNIHDVFDFINQWQVPCP